MLCKYGFLVNSLREYKIKEKIGFGVGIIILLKLVFKILYYIFNYIIFKKFCCLLCIRVLCNMLNNWRNEEFKRK